MSTLFEEQIDLLVKLQEVEKQIRSVRQRLLDVDDRCDAIRAQMDMLESELVEEEARVERIKKENREKERQVQDLGVKIKKSEEKLLSVKTNKEYQSSLKEIDDLKNKISDIEDLMIDEYEAMESGEHRLGELKEKLESERAEGERQIQDIIGEADRDRALLETHEAEYRQLSEQIPRSLHDRYEHIRGLQSNGMAISEVIKAVCQGCHLNIPPQLYNDLQKQDQLHYCPNCGRIIFWAKRIA